MASMSTALYRFFLPNIPVPTGMTQKDSLSATYVLSCVTLRHTEFGYSTAFLKIVFGHTERHIESQLPGQGSNMQPLHYKHGILMIGPPGKSMNLLLRRSFGCFSRTVSRSPWCRYANSRALYHTNPSLVPLHFHYSHSMWWWRDEISVSGPKIEANIKQFSNAQH